MTETVDVAVVGGGQAGRLSLSHELPQADVEHVVLERGEVGESWRRRWDSFCLVIPNWTVQLPGAHSDGPDGEGFMARDEVVAYRTGYARYLGAPVGEGVEVTSPEGDDDGRFVPRTSSGDIRARDVVLASGGASG
jgi:putative flavoprotein involved in K+ transport